MKRVWVVRIGILAIICAIAGAALPLGSALSASWGAPVSVESIPGTSQDFNHSGLDGCPFEAPDGLSFYMASDRPGGQGGIDIWKSTRSSLSSPWGAPVNLGAPVNTSADDFCPTLVQDGRLFFVSARAGGCGGPDIYVTSPIAGGGWSEPQNLGCQTNGPGPEFSPSLLDMGANGVVLFFSSARAGGFAPEAGGAAPDHDIYYSPRLPDGSFGAAVLVDGVNSAADDARPNVSADGLEMVFDSVRPGGLGGPDIWFSSRATLQSAWSAPANPGAPINSPQGETRPSLSRDGQRLYFGSARPGGDGGADIYVATRDGSVAAPPAPAPAPPRTGTGAVRSDQGHPWAFVILAAASVGALGLIGFRMRSGRASR
jgi:hypothetical protein